METMQPFQRINLSEFSQRITEHYQNFVVNEVNESCLRLAVFTGEYPWHRHPESDELFLVLEGELIIDFRSDAPKPLSWTSLSRPSERVHLPSQTPAHHNLRDLTSTPFFIHRYQKKPPDLPKPSLSSPSRAKRT
jgi:mannose-6-phosphate isomerase-like protein (cupin superfamily)